MMKECTSAQRKAFCAAYLQTMDPAGAAQQAGADDGFELLQDQRVKNRLETLRAAAAAQILREDVIRRLCQLAFGRSNDAVMLALSGEKEMDPRQLDLSAVAEFKRTDKGGLEVKFVDRIRALQALAELLGGDEADPSDFFRALEAAGDLEEGE